MYQGTTHEGTQVKWENWSNETLEFCI